MNDIHNLVPRLHTSYLTTLLRYHRVVILHGARQTGKTTLARMSPIGQNRVYLTLDDFEVADVAQRDPAALCIGATASPVKCPPRYGSSGLSSI